MRAVATDHRRHRVVHTGLLRLPEICGKVVFGGSKRNHLFMDASQSLYAV